MKEADDAAKLLKDKVAALAAAADILRDKGALQRHKDKAADLEDLLQVCGLNVKKHLNHEIKIFIEIQKTI